MQGDTLDLSAVDNRGLPYLTVKYAQTLDGRIATSTGQSRWISSEASLSYAHHLRSINDALMVGVGTVLKDNPRLTVRLVEGRNPLRVVVDSKLRTPLKALVLSDGNPRGTLFGVTKSAPAERVGEVQSLGARVFACREEPDGRVDLGDLLRRLRAEGIRSVMVEGGGQIITSLLNQGLVNRIVICIAPKLMGTGIEAVGDLGVASLPDAIGFSSFSFDRCGEDILFEGEIRLNGADCPAP